MEKAIRDRFNDDILATARQRYAIAADNLTELGGFESFIYGYSQNGNDYILRLGHSRRRSPNLIRGEVDWINYLAAGGAGVAKAVASPQGELVELLDDGQGGHFLATAFIKAVGDSAWKQGGWTEPWIENYGRLLGRIHALSKSYQPTQPAWRRYAWDDPINAAIPDVDPVVTAQHEATMAYLQQLPTDSDSYSMIHQDAHGGNLFITPAGDITLFDFDDCCYGHYVNDIAMVIFYMLTNRDDALDYGRFFWPIFWRGYCQENTLDGAWLAEIPHFMKLREVDLYAYIKRDVSDDFFGEDSWISKYMHGRLDRIAANQPTFNLDFAALVA